MNFKERLRFPQEIAVQRPHRRTSFQTGQHNEGACNASGDDVFRHVTGAVEADVVVFEFAEIQAAHPQDR
jgi:hypothetical protein